MIFQPGSCWKTARVAGETFSARTIFMIIKTSVLQYRIALAESVRDEGTQIVGDGAGALANAEATTLLIDHPEAQDGVALVKYGFRGECLIDLRAVVGAAG